MLNIINTTPHPIVFLDAYGTEFTVEPCGVIINATIVEELAETDGQVTLVRTVYQPDARALAALSSLEEEAQQRTERTVIVGSVIAAQAYPGHVFGLVASPGYERVPVAEKRMNPYKFVTFAPASEQVTTTI